MNTFGNKLKRGLEIRNISASELSRRLKVSRSTVSQWISGKYSVSADKIYQIGKALDINPAWFISTGHKIDKFRESDDDKSIDDSTIDRFLQLNEDNRKIVRGFIDGLLYKQNK